MWIQRYKNTLFALESVKCFRIKKKNAYSISCCPLVCQENSGPGVMKLYWNNKINDPFDVSKFEILTECKKKLLLKIVLFGSPNYRKLNNKQHGIGNRWF